MIDSDRIDITLTLNPHELKILCRLQEITGDSKKNTVMLAVVCLLQSHELTRQVWLKKYFERPEFNDIAKKVN